MSVISGEGKKDFIVAERVLDEEDDIVMLKPVYLVAGAPGDTEVAEIKEILEKSGVCDQHGWSWREYRVVPENDWADTDRWINKENQFYWASDIYHAQDIFAFTTPTNENGAVYDALVSQISGERRITLRLPIGLHVALSRAAKDMTMNSFCINVLAKAVGYSEVVSDFEANRRKPGRPKKVQDTE